MNLIELEKRAANRNKRERSKFQKMYKNSETLTRDVISHDLEKGFVTLEKSLTDLDWQISFTYSLLESILNRINTYSLKDYEFLKSTKEIQTDLADNLLKQIKNLQSLKIELNQ